MGADVADRWEPRWGRLGAPRGGEARTLVKSMGELCEPRLGVTIIGLPLASSA
jgi:hypothetical protein